MLTAPSTLEVEWHNNEYWLQQEVLFVQDGGYHLYFDEGEEKQIILPHVYHYEKRKKIVYFAAAEGYAMINSKTGIADVVLLSKNISPIYTDKIRYHDNWQMISAGQRELLLSLPHTLLAYMYSPEIGDGDSCTIGDGRFQYNYSRYSEEHIERNLKVWGLYGDFDEQDNLLSDVNGYKVFENGEGEIMYVTSPEGYAIVDGLSSTCRVYFTNSDLVDEDYHEDIQVLDSYEDFTPEEQDILERVEKEGLP